MGKKKRKDKKRAVGPKARPAAPMPGTEPWIGTMALTLLTVFMLIIGGLGMAMHRADFMVDEPEEPDAVGAIIGMVQMDLDPEMFFAAADALSQTAEPNLAQANIIFKETVAQIFEYRYDPKHIDDYRVTVTSTPSDLGITMAPMSMEASACTGDVGLSGALSRITAPAYYRVSGQITLDIQGPGDQSSVTNITIEGLVPNIAPYISMRLEEFEANGLSEYTDIGRMVRYMLTTLARFRAMDGVGTGPSDTVKNLLNEGDVELVVNLAILLEEARLFGTYDHEAVDAIDHYFYHATDPDVHLDDIWWEPYNPTGLKQWGSAEIKNYAKYLNKRDPSRTLRDLFDRYVDEGTMDPADLMALYLCLDQYSVAGQLTVDPKDPTSILVQKMKMDRRRSEDTRDISHLQYLVDLGPRELVLSDPSGTFGQDYRERLDVDHSPDYLVMGSQMQVDADISSPRTWLTNVKLEEGSRTGGVPPPQPPPDHDWMVQWEFRIWGEFDVSVGKDMTRAQSDGTGKGPRMSKTIELDIPINIFAFLNDQGPNINFTNINVGSPTGATFNFTTESRAYEHFAKHTWFEVKDLIDETLEDVIRLVKGSTCPYHACLAGASSITALDANMDMEEVPEDTWAEVSDFVEKRIIEPGLSTMILKPFMNFEYLMDIDYLDASDVDGVRYILRMTLRTDVGDISIDMMMSDGSLGPGGPTGWVGVGSTIVVDGLLDVIYRVEWDDDLEQVWLAGSGSMGGTWSVPVQEKGKVTEEGVDVEISPLLAVRVLSPESANIIDGNIVPITTLPHAPFTLSTYSADLSEKLLPTSWSSVLLSQDVGSTEWIGFEAKEEALMEALGWLEREGDAITDIIEKGRFDMTAMGMALALNIDDLTNLRIIAYINDSIYSVPAIYYTVSSQQFQLDRDIPTLRLNVVTDMTVRSEAVEHRPAWAVTIEYQPCTEYLLMDPEDPYG